MTKEISLGLFIFQYEGEGTHETFWGIIVVYFKMALMVPQKKPAHPVVAQLARALHQNR